MNALCTEAATIRRWWLTVILALMTLTGCAAVGPDYVPPGTSVPEAWHTGLNAAGTSGQLEVRSMAAWWTTINDPKLSGLIDGALAGNLDLKQARARIREARAQRAIAKAGFFPTSDAAGSATWSRSSGGNIGSAQTSELYRAGFDAGWELDIFGGVRRSVEAAEGDLAASQEDLRDVLVSLLAEVASNYVELRTFQARLAVAEGNIAVQEETYQLAVWKYQAGLSDALAAEEARSILQSTRSQIPTLRTGTEEAMNRIAVLLGEQPGTVHGELEKPGAIPVAPLEVAVGVPAEVLRRRPDVRRAERQLAAQTARVGVATAELYPKLTLSGSIGLEAFSLPDSAVRTVGGGPQITWPVFRGGAIRQAIEVQSALQEQVLIDYEATVLSALEEVENALVAYAQEEKRREVLSEGEQAARKAADLAQYLYAAGLTDFLNVLVTQRSLLSFQEQLAQSEGTVTTNLIKLYKALGGGWESLDRNEQKQPMN